jgi:tRNA pseudouridine13 synthase
MAGTKDRRGVTAQYVTVKHVRPERIAGVNARDAGVRVGNFETVARGLGLGHLRGNEFTIVVRDVTVGGARDAAAVSDVMKRWEECAFGFINYFGLQRFGTHSIPTSEVGRMMLKREWEAAVDHILCPGPSDISDISDAVTAFKARDFDTALALLPHTRRIERSIITKVKDGSSWQQAVESLPKHSRTLYLHAYQSKLWNMMVSARLDRYGTEVVAGDLVIDESAAVARSDKRHGGDIPVARVLSEEEARSGSFDITDVVLPIVGEHTKFPTHEVDQSWVESRLAEDGFPEGLAVFAQTSPGWAYLPGQYRSMMGKCYHMAWDVVPYTDGEESLVTVHPGTSPSGRDTWRDQVGKSGPVITRDELGASTDNVPHRLALRLQFQLRTSMYATMALRELMRSSTRASDHAALSAGEKKFKPDTPSGDA